jgi:phosphate transport system permease protein
MTKEERIKKRYRAEKRFKFYGIISILTALLFVFILVQNIVSKGSSAFFRTVIQTEVNFDKDALGLGNNPSKENVLQSDLFDFSVENLLNIYPVDDFERENEILLLFSPDYEIEIKKYLANNLDVIGQTVILELTSSDDIDQLNKGNFPRELPENMRRVSDFQLEVFDKLNSENQISKIFNNYFFSNGDSRDPELAGIGGSLMGSFFTVMICLLLSFPVAILASIYLEEFAPKNRITEIIEININNLAAVPSIVYGLLGLGILLNFMEFPRSTPLVAGITLSLMTLPRIIIPCRASLKAVPPSIREGALAVGASKFQAVFHHVVPLAMPGTLSGTIIGLAQALGETAPLILIGMVAFVVDVPTSPLDPSASLPVQVYLWSESAERGFVEKTSATIMMLLGFLIVMNFIAVYLRQKFERKWN